jgi:hypothetical protein
MHDAKKTEQVGHAAQAASGVLFRTTEPKTAFKRVASPSSP